MSWALVTCQTVTRWPQTAPDLFDGEVVNAFGAAGRPQVMP